MNNNFIIDYNVLQKFIYEIFIADGFEKENANIASEVLISADLRGIDSHGVARLSGYIRLADTNRIKKKPAIKVIYETPSTATVDADAALGLVSGKFAMEIAIQKAKNVGTGWVAVCDSNHFGIASHHAMMALPNDMIGISMTNASPLVAPTFSKEKMLGTNPICVCIPAKKFPAIVVDLATAAAANGKLEIAQRKGEKIPFGWAQDADGNASEDANILKSGGALLPLGSDRTGGSHKGFGLSAIVDIFSGVLSGANFGPWVPPFVSFLEPMKDLPGKGIGHFFGAMRIDAFRSKENFYHDIDLWIERFRNAETIAGHERVIIPGEPEYDCQQHRMQHGIPLNEKVVDDLKILAEKYNVELKM